MNELIGQKNQIHLPISLFVSVEQGGLACSIVKRR